MKTVIRINTWFATLLLLVMSAACNLPKPSFTPTAPIQASETPFPPATTTFIAGDLGWGPVHGTVTDAETGAPIVGAQVTCRHTSYVPRVLCNGAVLTDENGKYLFADTYLHDTDFIQVEVQAHGYVTQSRQADFITTPWVQLDIALAHEDTPQAVCTPPPCGPYEALYCPQGNCPGGCGKICATPAAICTPPLCAIGTREVYYCAEVCPGGCGTTCATFTPAP